MAGGGGAPTPSKGGKKSVDFNINLVPCIDLLSVLVSFLLITAVWTQLSRINTESVLPKASSKPDQQKEEEKKLLILLTPDGINVGYSGSPPTFIRGDGTNGMFKELLTKMDELKKTAVPDQKVIVAAEDKVPYKHLIATMDTVLNAGLTGISVGDAKTVKDQM